MLNHNWIFVAENLVFGGGTILVVEFFGGGTILVVEPFWWWTYFGGGTIFASVKLFLGGRILRGLRQDIKGKRLR